MCPFVMYDFLHTLIYMSISTKIAAGAAANTSPAPTASILNTPATTEKPKSATSHIPVQGSVRVFMSTSCDCYFPTVIIAIILRNQSSSIYFPFFLTFSLATITVFFSRFYALQCSNSNHFPAAESQTKKIAICIHWVFFRANIYVCIFYTPVF